MDSGAWKWSIWPGASAAVTLGRLTRPSIYAGDVIFECITPGTTGLAEPAWDLTIGNNTVDGGVTWQAVSYAVGASKSNGDGDSCDEVFHAGANRQAACGGLDRNTGRGLRIVGYYDGLIVPCAGCPNASPAYPIWNGNLYRRYCAHSGNSSNILTYTLSTYPTQRINGKIVGSIGCDYHYGTAEQTYIFNAALPPNGYKFKSDFVWLFWLLCYGGGWIVCGAWAKDGHSRSPEGTYTKIPEVSCSSPDTLDMELYDI